ncbi:MAG: ATP-binding protein [Armatimonadota bacterium]|nr:PAS domain-containing protein [bacterium]
MALRNISSPERGVLLLDRDHKVILANKRASVIFGIAPDEMVGHALPEVITRRPVYDEDVVEEVLDSLCSGNAIIHRYSSPVYSPDGSVGGRVEIYSDITARRELEKEILDRNVELAELNGQLQEAQEMLIHSERLRTLGEMAAGVAHDINNVLGIILGNAQLAKRSVAGNESALHSLEAIELAARDAAETIRRLREIGKPTDISSYGAVDLNSIVDDVVHGAFPAWQESGSHGGARIEFNTALSSGCIVHGNASELREALANIILNAAQAIEGAGRIEVYTARDGGHVEVAVTDTGIGMSQETKQRLFDPFFTTRGAQGTGLGMSMIDAIAIRHGGRVLVESEEGKGTRVTMRLPASAISS